MAYWSDTARNPDIFGMDARAIIPVFIWLLHWSWDTFYIACIGVLFFWLALRRGDTPENFLRKTVNRITLGDRSIIDSVVYRRRSRW